MRNSDRWHMPVPNTGFRMFSCLAWCIALLWSGPVAAANCAAIPNETLSTQNQVTNFQELYGPCDTVAGNLIIEFADFSDLNGLAGLNAVVGYFLLYYTSNLSSLVGLEGLTQVGDLSIESANLLTSLAGLQNLTSIGGLDILRNANLPNLVGLPSTLASVQNLVISGNPKMTSLDGMPAIGEITGAVQITENDMLANIAALAASGFPVGDTPQVDISIAVNPSLTSLSGLPQIDKVWTLGITSNTALSSLGGLEGLVEIWDGLTVIFNPALSDCNALRTVLDEVDDGAPGPSTDPGDPPDSPGVGYIWFEGNLDSCNSIAQIFDDTIFADGFEGPLAP